MIVRTDIKQNSLEWQLARSGIPTASEFDALISPTWEIRKGEGPKTFLAKKVAEAWQGGPLPSFSGFDLEQGHVLESEAIPWFEFAHDTEVQRVGFCTTDDGRIGCSPDGLIGDESGIEIKCPHADTHTRYLLNGELPKEYAAQVHGAMFVTGRKQWKFLSYRRNFPAFLLTVERHDGIQGVIAEALRHFLARFDDAMARMEKINGAPPRRFQPMPPKPSATQTADRYKIHELEVTP